MKKQDKKKTPQVAVMRNPQSGLPWAMCWTAPNQFVWRLFPTREEALAAAREASIGDFERGTDFSVNVARLPYEIPSTMAFEAWTEATDILLAECLARRNHRPPE